MICIIRIYQNLVLIKTSPTTTHYYLKTWRKYSQSHLG